MRRGVRRSSWSAWRNGSGGRLGIPQKFAKSRERKVTKSPTCSVVIERSSRAKPKRAIAPTPYSRKSIKDTSKY
jgi:hypothetical protein